MTSRILIALATILLTTNTASALKVLVETRKWVGPFGYDIHTLTLIEGEFNAFSIDTNPSYIIHTAVDTTPFSGIEPFGGSYSDDNALHPFFGNAAETDSYLLFPSDLDGLLVASSYFDNGSLNIAAAIAGPPTQTPFPLVQLVTLPFRDPLALSL